MTSSAETAKPTIDELRKFGTIQPETLGKARSEAINLVQWLARIANSFVAGKTPDDKIALEFRAADASLTTKAFENNLSLALRLPTLEMQFLENGQGVPHVFDPQEHSPAQVEAWILVELLHRGADRARFSKNLPYKISGLITGDAEEHSPQSCRQGLAYIAAWFQSAASIFDAAARKSGAQKVTLVCWPQMLELKCVSDKGSKPRGFGFSPGDLQHPEPYFYRNAHATNKSSRGEKRSVLTASKLLAQADPIAAAMTFLTPAMG